MKVLKVTMTLVEEGDADSNVGCSEPVVNIKRSFPIERNNQQENPWVDLEAKVLDCLKVIKIACED